MGMATFQSLYEPLNSLLLFHKAGSFPSLRSFTHWHASSVTYWKFERDSQQFSVLWAVLSSCSLSENSSHVSLPGLPNSSPQLFSLCHPTGNSSDSKLGNPRVHSEIISLHCLFPISWELLFDSYICLSFLLLLLFFFF